MTQINRRSFLKMVSILGVTGSLPTILTACDDALLGEEQSATRLDSSTTENSQSTTRSVLIIGAGAAGMSAGYLLKQQGVDFQILEASPTYGGRTKRTDSFADFPIPLGAEWLHAPESELQKIVNDSSVDITTEMHPYDPQDVGGYAEDGELYLDKIGDSWEDLKFVGATWFDFYDQYIVPSIRNQMQFNTQIVEINYQGDSVAITDQNGEVYTAEQVVVAVPLKILQDGDITFTPALPDRKIDVIKETPVWGGLKVFLEFSEKFYPTAVEFPDSDTEEGQRLYYDAAYGQASEAHVLGLFSVGEQAETYRSQGSDSAIKAYILAELDELFDGRASATYVKHLVQDWNKEPFIRGAYITDYANWRNPPKLSEPVDGVLFFAGTAFTDGNDWGSVHTAAQSGRNAVEALLEDW